MPTHNPSFASSGNRQVIWLSDNEWGSSLSCLYTVNFSPSYLFNPLRVANQIYPLESWAMARTDSCDKPFLRLIFEKLNIPLSAAWVRGKQIVRRIRKAIKENERMWNRSFCVIEIRLFFIIVFLINLLVFLFLLEFIQPCIQTIE